MLTALALTLIALLVAAACSDVAARIVPNWICGLIAACGVLIRIAAGLDAAIASSAAAFALFALLLIAFLSRALGGGDVKLATAVAFGLPPLGAVDFVVTTTMAGGALALLYLALRGLPQPIYRRERRGLAARILSAERHRICRRGPLPYAAAIAFGGILQWLPQVGT